MHQTVIKNVEIDSKAMAIIRDTIKSDIDKIGLYISKLSCDFRGVKADLACQTFVSKRIIRYD